MRKKCVLPKLQEDERIYLIVPYMNRSFAKSCHCGFDNDKKLWFTGCNNSNLDLLVKIYDVHEDTSEKAKKLLELTLKNLSKK